jgi:uncharacterized protein (DUF488 family)
MIASRGIDQALVADYLKSAGVTVLHIMSPTSVKPNPYTSAASIIDRRLSYGG